MCKGYDSFDVRMYGNEVVYEGKVTIKTSQNSLEQVRKMTRPTILLLLICVVLCHGYYSGSEVVYPYFISRNEWGARSPSTTIPPLAVNPPGYVIVHHSDTPGCTTRTTCNARVRSFQNYHMDTKKWEDIGYNFLIGDDGGNVYEGRGWGKHGAHSRPYNSKSIGVCFIGNYQNITPSRTVIAAFKNLTAYGVENGYLKPDYKILGHRQTTATDCPGNALYELIKTWPEWTDSP